MSLAGEIKDMMGKRGITAYRVWKDAGIDQGTLSKFFSGERLLVADTLIILLDYLGYELTIRKKRETEGPKVVL
jgi:transcriptional regulator with XRE-family HTH domain